MTDQQHPITPPPELEQQWRKEWIEQSITNKNWVCDYVATQAARWGADQELKACCEHINQWFAAPEYRVAELRAARRPQPKSLAEEALSALTQADEGLTESEWPSRSDVIRRALERLQELEGQGDD